MQMASITVYGLYCSKPVDLVVVVWPGPPDCIQYMACQQTGKTSSVSHTDSYAHIPPWLIILSLDSISFGEHWVRVPIVPRP